VVGVETVSGAVMTTVKLPDQTETTLVSVAQRACAFTLYVPALQL
jgi:hypothetical protein